MIAFAGRGRVPARACLILGLALFANAGLCGAAEAIPFATNGGLKMLYDNRQYPQAVADGDAVNIAFIWKVEDPLHNKRYDRTLTDHTQRYNLYYVFVEEEGMDEYGWGQRVEEWVSSDQGAKWKRARDLTPVSGLHYQNVQPVFDAEGRAVSDMLLFYGWKGNDGAGTAYLWDGR